MTNPFDFSSGDILTAANLNAIGAWTAYSPTWGGVDTTDATNSSFYTEVNGIVFLSGSLTFGAGTEITGNVSVTVPTGLTATESNKLANAMSWTFSDSNTNTLYMGRGRRASTTSFYAYAYYAASTYVSLIDISDNTKPFPAPWASGDLMAFSGFYQAA